MYNFTEIEKKWQKYWEVNKTFLAENNSPKEKYYVLVEFPYPSGSGLHVGHVRSYSALDSLARKRRMQGYNVLFPMGWDAFGLPAENYAIANKIHPREAVKENVKVFKEQIISLGLSFDWSREFSTTDPEVYKWTQWQFLQFYKHGLAKKVTKTINWCVSCKVGLANEDVENGKCERCGGEIVQKEKDQWILGMKSYAERLIEDLDDTNFLQRIKTAQINWIGKSEGAKVDFKIENTDEVLSVYTTRPDTLYGVTFMAVSPEHQLIKKLTSKIKNIKEVEAYKEMASKKSEFERIELVKEKTGVKLDGIYAINPLNNEKIQVWSADYVMMGYGTGAIMAVPAHDQRDYEFAQKYDIPIIEVIKGGDISKEAYTGDGEMVNSDLLNGITNKAESISKMIEYLETKKIGEKTTDYRLQDWPFSRQRFWGEPFPMIHCDDCGWVPVPEEELPVLLPDVAHYEVTDNGESPLVNIPEWYNAPCPKCGKMGKRETDTMPQWAGSSWYYLRYTDPNNNKEFASMDALKYWGKVDYYNGGMEHTTRHLLYARFWHKFLYDIGLVPTKEPFNTRVSHGVILGETGEKMSKSKGNTINPNEIVNEYGADALRTYELFIGDYEKEVSWNTNGLKGCKRFLDKVWRLQNKLSEDSKYSKELEMLINKTIKKITNDLENMKYNTAVSQLMILTNELEKQKTVSKKEYRTLLMLLNPIAPHLTEELNEINKLGNPLCESVWPIYDESKIVEDTYELIVQINGKVRAKIEVDSDMDEEEMKNIALDQPNVKSYTEGATIDKIIVVKRKLVSIVIK